MIDVSHFTKTYTGKKKKIQAVNDLSFNVREGEIFGIIGPTGAGKTTTIKMLSTLVLPDSGHASIHGYDIQKNSEQVREKIGVLVGEFTRALYWRLTGKENLEFFAKINGIPNTEMRCNYLLELFKLKQYEHDLLMTYSTGMKHKLALAVALLKDPPILFFDEPLTGIDPVTAFEIKHLIKKKYTNKTILWASHNLYEIEEMCDRVLLLKNGSMMLTGQVDELKERYWNYETIRIECKQPEKLLHLSGTRQIGRWVELKTTDINKTLRGLLEVMKEKQVDIQEIRTTKPSLEHIFMSVIENAGRI